jgi:outer membrane lipoprotein-sorting protein
MPKIFVLAILAFYSSSLPAQNTGYELLVQTDNFKKSFTTATSSLESIKSDFIQEKNLSLLSEKITSTGKFWYKRKERVRMEYLQPYYYLLMLNQGKIIVKDGQKESKFSAASNKVFQQVNQILLDCVSGHVLDNPDFQYRVFESPSSWLIELTPAAKNLQKIYKNIRIQIDKKDYSAKSIEMVEISGDNTVIRFQNKELNAQIPDSVFINP